MRAGQKWLELLLNVLDYELEDGPLLSEGADTLVKRYPVAGRIFIICVGSVITLHLSNLLPVDLDPMAKTFWRQHRGR